MASHTTSGEWQSFELRMRRRRAQRLSERAQAAIDDGRLEDARLCVDEARSLDPTLPQLATLNARISSPVDAVSAPPRRAAAIVVAFAASIAVLIAAWALAPAVTQQLTSATPAEPRSATAPVVGAVEPAPVSTAVSTPASAPVAASEPAADSQPGETPRERLEKESSALAATSGRGEAAIPQVEPEIRNALATPPKQDTAVSPRIETDIPVPQPASPKIETFSVPVETSRVALPVAPMLPPARPAAPAEPAQEPAVRSVLDRYASAYNTLDADAAQRVWPGVNHGALARAFENLESQQISLGDCRVNVTGSTATATCAGNAAWTPKVGGGGQRSAPRRWSFDLARTGAAWQIVNARVQ